MSWPDKSVDIGFLHRKWSLCKKANDIPYNKTDLQQLSQIESSD